MATHIPAWKAITVLVALGALVCVGQRSRVAAQTQAPAPLTIDSAPERILYEVFFQAVVAWDRRASDPEVPAARRNKVRDHMREVVGLDVSDYQLVKSVAYWVVSFLQENAIRADAILRDAKLSAEDRQKALALLKAERDAAIDAAVLRLRNYFGSAGFWELDQRVRGHIVPRLRILTTPSGPPPPKQE